MKANHGDVQAPRPALPRRPPRRVPPTPTTALSTSRPWRSCSSLSPPWPTSANPRHHGQVRRSGQVRCIWRRRDEASNEQRQTPCFVVALHPLICIQNNVSKCIVMGLASFPWRRANLHASPSANAGLGIFLRAWKGGRASPGGRRGEWLLDGCT